MLGKIIVSQATRSYAQGTSKRSLLFALHANLLRDRDRDRAKHHGHGHDHVTSNNLIGTLATCEGSTRPKVATSKLQVAYQFVINVPRKAFSCLNHLVKIYGIIQVNAN